MADRQRELDLRIPSMEFEATLKCGVRAFIQAHVERDGDDCFLNWIRAYSTINDDEFFVTPEIVEIVREKWFEERR